MKNRKKRAGEWQRMKYRPAKPPKKEGYAIKPDLDRRRYFPSIKHEKRKGERVMLPAPTVPVYQCRHHRWEHWNHYGQKMPEHGCKLSSRKFGCPYRDADKCPFYEPKNTTTNDTEPPQQKD